MQERRYRGGAWVAAPLASRIFGKFLKSLLLSAILGLPVVSKKTSECSSVRAFSFMAMNEEQLDNLDHYIFKKLRKTYNSMRLNLLPLRHYS